MIANTTQIRISGAGHEAGGIAGRLGGARAMRSRRGCVRHGAGRGIIRWQRRSGDDTPYRGVRPPLNAVSSSLTRQYAPSSR